MGINIGKNTTEEFTAELYIDGRKTSNTTIDGLSKGETYPLSFEWIPEGFGDYNVKIELDPENSTEEQDENNNQISKEVSVNITSLQWWNFNWHYLLCIYPF